MSETTGATLNETADLDAARREWLTVAQVCAELNISARTWDRMRASGRAPRVKVMGGSLRIRRDWLDEWAERDEDSA
jgi:excisionase family DNA binding protein